MDRPWRNFLRPSRAKRTSCHLHCSMTMWLSAKERYGTDPYVIRKSGRTQKSRQAEEALPREVCPNRRSTATLLLLCSFAIDEKTSRYPLLSGTKESEGEKRVVPTRPTPPAYPKRSKTEASDWPPPPSSVPVSYRCSCLREGLYGVLLTGISAPVLFPFRGHSDGFDSTQTGKARVHAAWHQTGLYALLGEVYSSTQYLLNR